MPKHNANDMVMAWLDAKIHENPDSFDAINAENCLALIRKQRKQLISLGAHFCNLKKQRDRLQKELEQERMRIIAICSPQPVLRIQQDRPCT